MVCQFCKKKEATVYLTQIVENQVKKVDLCDQCAKQKGVNDPAGFSLADLLLGLGASQEMEKASERAGAGADLTCPTCGYTQSNFKKTGRLGCSDCYVVFAKGLEGLLKGMHKGVQHKGKVPAKLKHAASQEALLVRLRSELDQAVDREDFEKAAQLRDEIKLIKAGSTGAAP